MTIPLVERTETDVLAILDINPKHVSPFAKKWITQAYSAESEANLKSFLKREEHLKNLNALSKDEIKILESLNEENRFTLVEDFTPYITIKTPFTTAIVMIGYEMRCLSCGAYHQNNKSIGFVYPKAEIEQAYALGKTPQEINALIPDIVCPECGSKNNMEYFLDLLF